MTNRIAILLGLTILIALVLDLSLNGGEATTFLAKKLADLIEWLAFWR